MVSTALEKMLMPTVFQLDQQGVMISAVVERTLLWVGVEMRTVLEATLISKAPLEGLIFRLFWNRYCHRRFSRSR